jgi:hypothetical protein
MASGINSTFRQVGIATGIALLGTLFANRVSEIVTAKVAAVPGLAGKAQQITTAVKSGGARREVAHVTPKQGEQLLTITREAFTAGLDRIFLVGAIIAFVTGVLSLVLIRPRDFVQAQPDAAAG